MAALISRNTLYCSGNYWGRRITPEINSKTQQHPRIRAPLRSLRAETPQKFPANVPGGSPNEPPSGTGLPSDAAAAKQAPENPPAAVEGGAGGGCKARAPATQPWMPGMAAAPRRFAFYGPTLPDACPAPGKDPELGCEKKKKKHLNCPKGHAGGCCFLRYPRVSVGGCQGRLLPRSLSALPVELLHSETKHLLSPPRLPKKTPPWAPDAWPITQFFLFEAMPCLPIAKPI